MAKAGIPSSRQIPAMAKWLASLVVKRCRVLGYLLPVNSKNAVAGIRQRFDCAKLRPSERKLNTGAALGRGGAYPLRLLSAQIGWNVPLHRAVARFKCKACGTPFGSVKLGPINSGDGHSSPRAGMIDLVPENESGASRD